jgi:hypothetical protein
MKVLIDGLVPRLFPNLSFLSVPHEGKRDLELSIPRKLRAWREPGVLFVVVQDNDGSDCLALKEGLAQRCAGAGRPDTLVRIVCQELEAWYLGDLEQLTAAFHAPELAGLGNKAAYRNPDAIVRPSSRLTALVPAFQKVSGAREMSRRLTREGNASRSFQVFVDGIARLAGPLAGGS